MSGFLNHSQGKALLARLYGEADDLAERVDKRDVDAQFRADYATKRFEERV